MEWSVNKIPKLTQEWTDFTITDAGIIWVNAMSTLYDNTHYMLDRKYMNNIARYSKSVRNLIDMCNLMGMEVSGLTASLTELSVEIETDMNVKLPKATRLEVYDATSGKSIYLNTIKEYELVRGMPNRIICIEGAPVSETVYMADFDEKNRYYLDKGQIALNSVEVMVNGLYWEKEPDAFLSNSKNPSYSVHRSSSGKIMIKVSPRGRAVLGENGSFTLKYTNSEGSGGNIAKSSDVKLMNNKFKDIGGKLVEDKIKFKVLTSGGGDEEMGLEDIRKFLGEQSNATETLVNDTDYANIPKYVPNLYQVTANSIGNVMQVFYEPDENYPNLEEIEANLKSYVAKRVPIFTKFEINRMKVRPFTLKLVVYLNRNEIRTDYIEEDIKKYLKREYSKKNQVPGDILIRSQLAARLSALSPVISHINIPEPIIDIQCDWNQIFDLSYIIVEFQKVAMR